MKKIFIFILALSFLNANLSAASEKYPIKQPYFRFDDINEEDWFFESVKICQQTQLVMGVGNNLFDPKGFVTLQQGIALAARLHQIYFEEDEISAEAASNWFESYYDYCLAHNIIDKTQDKFLEPITREKFVNLLVNIYPDTEFTNINEIKDIPDIKIDTEIGEFILKLYESGILSGIDNAGSFAPNNYIRRSEICAIISRIIRQENRIRYNIQKPTNSVTIQKLPINPNEISLFLDENYLNVFNKTTGEYALLNFDGEEILPWGAHFLNVSEDIVSEFKDNEDINNPRAIYQYYNIEGKLLSQSKYMLGTEFYNGKAAVQDFDGNIYLVDKNFNILKKFSDNKGYRIRSGINLSVCEGYIMLDDGGISGQITILSTETGEIMVIKGMERFQYYTDFFDDVYIYTDVNTHYGEYNLIDDDLNLLLPKNYTLIEPYKNGYVVIGDIINDEIKYGVVDFKGNFIYQLEYDSIPYINKDGLAIFLKDGKYSLKNMKGETLLDFHPENNAKYKISDEFIISSDNLNKMSVYDIKGNLLISGLDNSCYNEIDKYIKGNRILCQNKEEYYWIIK